MNENHTKIPSVPYRTSVTAWSIDTTSNRTGPAAGGPSPLFTSRCFTGGCVGCDRNMRDLQSERMLKCGSTFGRMAKLCSTSPLC